MIPGQNTIPESEIVDSESTRRTKQPLRKHRVQPPFRNQQQSVEMVQVNRHRAQRIPFTTKPKMTRENGLQLPQARLEPEQERGLSDQGIDEIRTSAA